MTQELYSDRYAPEMAGLLLSVSAEPTGANVDEALDRLERIIREHRVAAFRAAAQVAASVAAQYPTDIFPAGSTSPDACAAKGARLAASLIERDLNALADADRIERLLMELEGGR